MRLGEVGFSLVHSLGSFFSLFPVFHPWYLSAHLAAAMKVPHFPSQCSSGLHLEELELRIVQPGVEKAPERPN